MDSTVLNKATVSRFLKASTFLNVERRNGSSVLMVKVWQLELSIVEITHVERLLAYLASS